MNMQAMLQQAQRIQKEILETKKGIEDKIYFAEKELVSVEMNGKKKITNINIKKETIEKDDVEMLEDSILLLINECTEKIDLELEQKTAKFGPGIKEMI